MRIIKSIKRKCLAYSSDYPKEVKLCHIFDCPLWPHRLGAKIKTNVYRASLEKALKRYNNEIIVLLEIGIDTGLFLKYSAKTHQTQKNPEQAKSEKGHEQVKEANTYLFSPLLLT